MGGGSLAGDQFDDFVVNLFDPVVALLVEAIDRTLDPSDLGIADVGAARDVFFVPELEVKAVLRADDVLEASVRIVDVFIVPAGNGGGL